MLSVDPNKLNHILEMSDTISTDLLRSSGPNLKLLKRFKEEPNRPLGQKAQMEYLKRQCKSVENLLS